MITTNWLDNFVDVSFMNFPCEFHFICKFLVHGSFRPSTTASTNYSKWPCSNRPEDQVLIVFSNQKEEFRIQDHVSSEFHVNYTSTTWELSSIYIDNTNVPVFNKTTATTNYSKWPCSNRPEDQVLIVFSTQKEEFRIQDHVSSELMWIILQLHGSFRPSTTATTNYSKGPCSNRPEDQVLIVLSSTPIIKRSHCWYACQ